MESINSEEENEIRAWYKKALNSDIRTLNKLIYQSRKKYLLDEIVPIETFINDPYFLGSDLKNVLYPCWMNLLKKIHGSPYFNNFYEIIFEAPLSSGKSYVSSASICYEIYRLLMYENPQRFYKLGNGTKIFFLVFSVTLSSSEVNWNYIKTFIEHSKFFQEAMRNFNRKISKATKIGSNEQHIAKDIFVGLGSNTDHSISRRVFGGVLDEGNFQKGASNQAHTNYSALATRIEASFGAEKGTPPGILWLCSSPTLESSFTTERIEEAKGNDTTLVIENNPIWKIKKHLGIYKSNKFFYVYEGDEQKDPFIVTDENISLVTNKEKLIKVPMEHYKIFKTKTKISLRDLAGRRLKTSSIYFKSKDSLKEVLNYPSNYFKNNILKVGLKEKDSRIIIENILNLDFFKNPPSPHSYRFIHIDIGAKIDRCGIGCAYSTYKNEVYYSNFSEVNQKTERFYYLEWVLALEALEGDEIPFEILVDFLYYLKKLNYPIKLVTTDQMEGGRKLRQDIARKGITTDYLSVDKDIEPWEVLYDIVHNKDGLLTNDPLLFLELSELIDNSNTGLKPVIDHPKYFSSTSYLNNITTKNKIKGTKDVADGGCGAIYNAYKAKKIFNDVILFNQAKETNQNKGLSLLKLDEIFSSHKLEKLANKLK